MVCSVHKDFCICHINVTFFIANSGFNCSISCAPVLNVPVKPMENLMSVLVVELKEVIALPTKFSFAADSMLTTV